MNIVKKIALLLFLVSFFYPLHSYSASIPSATIQKIGEKIWKNECGGRIEGLTSWNKNEKFPSLGIGHFIWYHEESEEKFEETFPSLLVFLEKRGATLPSWLKSVKRCPWKSREDFLQSENSAEMTSLRDLLFNTKDLQAIFIVNRLEKTFSEMIQNYPQKKTVTATFENLSKDAKGLYALIDYLNFKGSGMSSKEQYKEKGWGLLQVLEKVPPTSPALIFAFVTAAKEVLTERVKNSPPENNEQKWLPGWFNRLDTYLEPF